MSIRRLQFTEGSSNKFWEASLEGARMTVRWGRIGAVGQQHVKKFATAAAAKTARNALVAEKRDKGYVDAATASPKKPTASHARAKRAAPAPSSAPDDPRLTALRKALDAVGLAKHAPAIEKRMHHAIELIVRPATRASNAVGASRLGGLPDLPPGTEWPFHEDRHEHFFDVLKPGARKKVRVGPVRRRSLDFVAQVRLEDVAPHDRDGLLPKTGLLSFFVLSLWDANLADEPDYLSISRVLYCEDLDGLATASVPTGYLRWRDGNLIAEPFPAQGLAFAEMLTDPLPGELDRLGLSQDDRDALGDALLEYGRQAPETPGRLSPHAAHHLLGAASSSRVDEPKSTLLLQCNSNRGAGMVWGDGHLVFFRLPPAALKARNFSRVWSRYHE